MFQYPGKFFIGGTWVDPSTDSTIDVIMPSTEEVFVTVAEAQEADMMRAIAAARDAFDRGPWPRMSHAERAEYLKAFSEQVLARGKDFSELWTSEVGVISSMAAGMPKALSNAFSFYAGLADTYPWVEKHTPAMGGQGFLVREAVGVVGAIIPWNAPLSLVTYKIAPALLAGCTIILKASPEAPGAALLIAEVAQAIGLPAGVLNVLTADREVSELLVRDARVDKISFTGSSAAGRKIAAICGDRIARCTLELGGKSAGVVLDDYDVEKVAKSLAISAPRITGQVCSSLTRIIVTKDRHDQLVDAMSAAFADIKVGDPFDQATQMGPLTMSRQRDRVEEYIAKGRAQGAKVAVGGGRPSHLNRGYFVEPTVFCNVDNDMIIAREEIFGPVVSVIPADNEEQAIEIANDTVFGLNASVFTDDIDRAYEVSRALRSGTVGHNGFKTDFTIAFGGFKQSGIGREGGTEGLHPFLEVKTLIMEGTPSQVG